MTPESSIVVVTAAAMFLVGVACSPLGWAALKRRRSRFEDHVLERLGLLSRRIQELESEPRTQAPRKRPEDSRGSAHGEPRTPPSVLISVPNLEPAGVDRSGAGQSLAERYAAVWKLADQGGTIESISRETQTPVGQIELILGLRRSLQTRTTYSHPPHSTPGRERA